MPDEFDEYGIPIKNKRPPSEVDEFGIPVKKKEPQQSLRGGGWGFAPFTPKFSQSKLPSEEKPIDKTAIASFVTGKSKEELQKQSEKNRTLKGITPAKYDHYDYNTNPSDEDYQKSYQKLGEIMYSDDDKWKDPVKHINQQQLKDDNRDLFSRVRESNAAQDIIQSSIARTPFEAKRTLFNSVWGEGDENNETTNFLKNKVDKYEKAVGGLREELSQRRSGYNGLVLSEQDLSEASGAELNNYFEMLNRAAFDWKLKTDKHFAEQVASGAEVNSYKRGQIFDEWLHDENTQSFFEEENPNLKPALDFAKQEVGFAHPGYGLNLIAQKISQAREDEGYNNPIVTFDDAKFKRTTDEVAKRVLNPREYELFEKEIKDNPDEWIKTPGLLENIAHSSEGVLIGTVNTFASPFTSTSKAVEKEWAQEAKNITVNQNGWNRFWSGTGDATGFVLGLMSTGNVVGSPAVALSIFGDALDRGKAKFPNSAPKAYASAIFETGVYQALGKRVFPTKGVKEALSKVRPEIQGMANRLANGQITQDVAKREMSNTLKKAFQIAAGGTLGAAKVSAELTAAQHILFRNMDKLFMDDETFKKYYPEDASLKDAEHLFLDNLLLMGLTKYGKVKRENNIAKESYYKLAENPKFYGKQIDNMSVDKSFADIAEMKSNLKDIGELKKWMDANEVPVKEQKEFLFQFLKGKINTEAKDATKDPIVREHHENIIKESEAVRQKILDGKTVEDINREQFVDLLNDAVSAAKTDIKDPIFREGFIKDPENGLKALAQQLNASKGEAETARAIHGDIVSDIALELFPNETADKSTLTDKMGDGKLLTDGETAGQPPVSESKDVLKDVRLPKGAKEIFHYSENESLKDLEEREGGTWFTENSYGYSRRGGVKGKVSKVIEPDKLNLATEKEVLKAGEGNWKEGVKKIKEQGFDGVKQKVDGDNEYLIFNLKNVKDKSEYSPKSESLLSKEQPIEQKQSATEEVTRLETERDERIRKEGKPDVKMEFVPAKELVESKDPIGNKNKHNEIKDKYKRLRELLDCLWAKK